MKIHFGLGNSAAEDYYFVQVGDVRATYETGLRVGNSDPRDTLRTTNLSAISPISPLNAGAPATDDGFFGIRYTENFDAEKPGDETWQLYGYVAIDASRTSINEIVQNINKGSQAQGTLHVATSGATLGANLTINGQIFSFTTSGTASTYSGATGTILVGASDNNTAYATKISNFLNAHAASIGVYGAIQGTTVHLVAYDFGVLGNNIGVSSNVTSMQFDGTTLQGGGRQVLTASTYYDEVNNVYQLQLQMNHGGEKYQIQTFGLSTAATGGTIMGGIIPGVAMNSTNSWMGALSTVTGVLQTFAALDAQNEWIQPQNGSGRTEWDGADILTQSNAQKALSALDNAITKKDGARANLGAIQNRLENTITTLQIQAENLQAAESRISDVDVATEMTEFTRNNILAQAAVAMLAQANSLPQLALSLIR